MGSNPDIKTFEDYEAISKPELLARLEALPGAESILEALNEKVDRLFSLWSEKVLAYGLSRYETHSREFDVWMSYAGVWRKQIRLGELTSNAAQGDPEAYRALLDAYADTALYALSALVVLEDPTRAFDKEKQ